jgi:hypothetical protein
MRVALAVLTFAAGVITAGAIVYISTSAMAG